MREFLATIKAKAKQNPKRIIFPEGFEPRILATASTLLHEKTAIPVILGDKEDLMKQAKEAGHTIEWNRLEVINPHTDSRLKAYAKTYFEMRKGAITEKAALEEMENNINTFGTMLVEMGEVDGMISGTTFPTSDTVRPALRIIKTKEKFHKVSGFFFMILEKRILLFADCAILEDPNSNELADIAIDTAETARRFGIEPRVAMLSFSTAGSGGSHPFVKKVQEATKMVKYKRPDLIVEGEMQVDAALIPAVCRRKFPQIKTPGDFNVLIFPDLQSGNISYKLVQRLAGADAIGPILQGLNKPVNDLSRGCSAEDIVNLAAFTTIEAQGVEKYLE